MASPQPSISNRKENAMKKIFRQMTALVLSFVLMTSLLSLTGFASDESDAESPDWTDIALAEIIDKLQLLETKGTSSVIGTDLYIEENPAFGIDSRIYVVLNYLGGEATLYLPGNADLSQLRLAWDDSSIVLNVDGVDYGSGEAPIAPENNSITYTCTQGNSSSSIRIKTMKGSDAVNPMYLELDESLGTIDAMNTDLAHETSCFGSMRYRDMQKAISIKGRGNSTWKAPKKPYGLTIYADNTFADKKKAELISGVKSKKWSLLANYFDSSMIRNKIALDLANQMGIGLETEFVDLWMNGKYLGNYLLTPKKDYISYDEGYILENDHFDELLTGNQFEFPKIQKMPKTKNMINVVDIGADAKKTGTTIQSIQEWFGEAWDAVLDVNSEDYQNYFDIESWAKLYLMFEVSKNFSCFAGNILMHRNGLSKNDKLIAGPAWDYDIAFGRTYFKNGVGVTIPMQMNAEGWYNDSVGFSLVTEPYTIFQGLDRHKSFRQCIEAVYQRYRWAFEDLDDNANRQAEVVHDSVMMNNNIRLGNSISTDFVIAPTTMGALGSGKYKLNYRVTTSWEDYVYNLKEFCQKRVMWLTDTINNDANNETPFTDIRSTDWHYPYVKYVYDNGLFSGTSSNTFEPGTAMTRGMFVTVLWSREGKPSSGSSSFKDLKSDWYQNAVAWAAENKIVGGYSDTMFGPEDPITREQMVAIMYQYASFKKYKTGENGSLDRFADADSVSGYAVKAMKWAVSNGIISGTEKGLEPQSFATRAQVAVVMKAFDEKIR